MSTISQRYCFFFFLNIFLTDKGFVLFSFPENILSGGDKVLSLFVEIISLCQHACFQRMARRDQNRSSCIFLSWKIFLLSPWQGFKLMNLDRGYIFQKYIMSRGETGLRMFDLQSAYFFCFTFYMDVRRINCFQQCFFLCYLNEFKLKDGFRSYIP